MAEREKDRFALQRKSAGFFSRWKTFSYQVRDTLLFEYKAGSNPKTSEPLAVIDMEDCVVEDGVLLTGRENSFVVHTNQQKSFFFAAGNEAEKLRAMQIFRGSGVEKRSTSGSSAGTESSKTKLTILNYLDSFTDATIVGNGNTGLIVGINAAAEKLFGFSKAEAVGQPLTILMPEPYKSQHDAFLFRHEKFGAEKLIGKTRTLRGERKNKESFPLQISLGKLPADGYYVATIRPVADDLTVDYDLNEDFETTSILGGNNTDENSRIVESTNKARNEVTRYVKMMESFTDAQVIGNARTGLIYAMNPAAEKLFGFKKGAAVNKNIKVLMPEPYKTQHDGYLFRFDKTKRERLIGQTRHLQGERVDKSVFDMELSLSKLPVEGFYVASIRPLDVEENKKDQSALEEINAFVNIMNSFTDASVMATVHDRQVYAINPSAEKMFGYLNSEIIGKNVAILMPDQYKVNHDKYMQEFEETGRETFIGKTRKLSATRKSGEIFDVEISLSKLMFPGYILATLRETGSRKPAK